MNKQGYLHELEKALKAVDVSDSEDILEEYAEHFDLKLQDGYSEEEIAARLAPPKEIAEQFGEIKTGVAPKAGNKIISAIGLFFADIVVFPFLIMFYAWVFTFGAVALASALTGFFCIAVGRSVAVGPAYLIMIPEMPYICALLLGVTLLALAVLAACGTEYFRLCTRQIAKVYIRWHKSVIGRPSSSPPLPKHPVIKPKKRRIMRNVTLIALIVFVVAFIAAFVSMMIAAGAPEFWHVWEWFE